MIYRPHLIPGGDKTRVVGGVLTLTKNGAYDVCMFQKSLKVILLSLIVSLLPSNFQVANSNEILWNPGLGSDINSPPNLVPGAKIRNTGMLVYKSNPDELIMKIIMNDSFEQMPFSGKGRNLGMTIWLGREGCYYSDRLDCERVHTIWAPNYPSTYPSNKSSEYVSVYNRDVKFAETPIASNCKAFWWIDSTYKNRDTWAFSVSITCLKIPKEFGTYAFSAIDIGQKDVAYDFSAPLNLVYPFHDLAASAAAKNKESILPAQGKKQICVLAKTGKGYDEVIDFEEQCSDSNSQWEFTYCDSHTKSDLEVFQNKKWKKVKTVKSSKGYCDDPSLSNSFTHKSPLIGKYRIKSYGNTKFTTAYLNLEIYRKDIA